MRLAREATSSFVGNFVVNFVCNGSLDKVSDKGARTEGAKTDTWQLPIQLELRHLVAKSVQVPELYAPGFDAHRKLAAIRT